VVDVGGTHVKVQATGRRQRVKLPSGPKMTPARMVAAVRTATAGWSYDAVAIGYPGVVIHDAHSVNHTTSGAVGSALTSKGRLTAGR